MLLSHVALRKEIFDYHHDYEQQYCWSMVTLDRRLFLKSLIYIITLTENGSCCTKETEWTS